MRSSWTRALACSSSSEAQARTRRVGVGRGGDGVVAPPAERRAEHLAAGDRRPGLRRRSRVGVGAERREPLGLLVEGRAQRGLDAGPEARRRPTSAPTPTDPRPRVVRIGVASPPSPDNRAMTTGRGRSIEELLEQGEHSFSFEFFPPKDEAGEAQLWARDQRARALRARRFVSVTYGAGGSTRDTTVRITGRIAQETSLTPVAHLTCVGHTREELERILDAYPEAGVQHLMALRGDPSDGPRAPWTATAGRAQLRHRAGRAGPLARRLPDRRGGVPRGPPVGRVARRRTPTCWSPRPEPARSSRSPRCSSGPPTTSTWSSGSAPAASTSRSCRASCRS